MTKRMTPAAYGELILAVTIVALLQQSLFAPAYQAAQRFYGGAKESGARREYIHGLAVLLFWPTVVVTAAGVLLSSTALLRCSFLVAVLTVLTCFQGMLLSIQIAARMRKAVAFQQSMLQWLRPIGALVAFRQNEPTMEAALQGYCIATLVLCLLATGSTFYCFRGWPKPLADIRDGTFLSTIHSFAWPFLPSGLLAWAQTASDRWALQLFSGSAAVGSYAAAWQVGSQPLTFAANAILQAVAPHVYSAAGSGVDPERIAKATRLQAFVVTGFALVTVFLMIAAAATSRWWYSALLGARFRTSEPYFPFLVFAGGLVGIITLTCQLFSIQNRTSELILPRAVVTVICLAGNCIGAARWGTLGVIASGLVSSAILIIWLLWRFSGTPRGVTTPSLVLNQR